MGSSAGTANYVMATGTTAKNIITGVGSCYTGSGGGSNGGRLTYSFSVIDMQALKATPAQV